MANTDITRAEGPLENADDVKSSGLFGIIGSSLEQLVTPGVVRFVAPALFGLVMVAVAIGALVKPAHNWDMAPYIAVALENEITDPAALHEHVWGLMEASATPGQFHTLTLGTPYNIAQYENTEFFNSQLGMYRVKYGYVEALRLLGPIVGYVEATQVINFVSVLVFGIVLLLWMHRFNAIEGTLILAPFMLATDFLTMAQLANPDLMTFSAFLVAVYLLRIGKDWWAVPAMLTAFLIRPDGIIFIFALLIATLLLGGKKLPMLSAFAASIVGYFLITQNSGHPGWWPHFVFSNLQLQNDMLGFQPQFDIVVYIKSLVRGVSVGIRFGTWVAVSAILLLSWVLLRRSGKEPVGTAAKLLLALILCVGGKFITFPLPDDRVYFLYILLTAVLLIESWKPRFDLARRC
ncbi:MAG: hypothetical protein GY789_28605 [Hyphomicrobiales bacterium]|nr:hypothetical protein [Hyphomicrobiales bacterium]MCP4998733.1 hypothetical protein [Hyphomicrobiales bacterium]